MHKKDYQKPELIVYQELSSLTGGDMTVSEVTGT